MIEVKQMAAQGDVIFRRVDKLPDGVTEVPRGKKPHVVAHSETGHHHVIDALDARMYHDPKDPLVCYLQAGELPMDAVHQRAWDTHATLRLLSQPGDLWEVRRQREWSPEGWQRVED